MERNWLGFIQVSTSKRKKKESSIMSYNYYPKGLNNTRDIFQILV